MKNHKEQGNVIVFIILSLTLLLIVFGYISIDSLTKSKSTIPTNVTSNSNEYFTNTNTDKVNLNSRKLIKQKDINGGTVKAFRFDLTLFENLNSRGFYAVTIEGSNIPALPIYFTLEDAYGDPNVFDVVPNMLVFINGITNSLDIYEYTPPNTNIVYIKSYSLPDNAKGNIYHISCDMGYCKVKSASSMGSGCTMNFEPKTGIFSTVICSSFGDKL